MKARVLSGMRPTGPLHLGHLVGALKNWVQLQDKYECYFMIADWHALMSEYREYEKVGECAIDNLIDWLSAGLDPEKAVIFLQSDVPQHAELNLLLSIITPLSWLERCPTYKEQMQVLKDKEITTYGFLGYPVLQSADIILYKAEFVPVGEDQLPHLELCREIVRRFHFLFKKEIFPEPQAMLTPIPKLLGLDGRKMSKSYGNFIALGDNAETIRSKVKSMFTDPERIKLSDPGRPEVCNVYSYYKTFAPEISEEVYRECTQAEIGCVQDKERLAELLIQFLKPFQEKRKQIASERKYLEKILKEGSQKARRVASSTMREVKELIGI